MKESYLLLQSINPTSNRYRVYRVHVLELETLRQTRFIVSCAWGRYQKLSHAKKFVFEEEDQLQQFLQSLLKTRKRHHYSLIDSSPTFPSIKVLTELKRGQLCPSQATLF